MYGTLDTGAVRRIMTVADLNVRSSDGGGADALHAAVARSAATDLALAAALTQYNAASARSDALTRNLGGALRSSEESRSLRNATLDSRDTRAARTAAHALALQDSGWSYWPSLRMGGTANLQWRDRTGARPPSHRAVPSTLSSAIWNAPNLSNPRF